MYLRFDRAHRQLQLGSDLLVGVFLEKAQLDQFPVAGRHSFEKRFEPGAALVGDHPLFGRGTSPRRGDALADPVDRNGVVALAAHVVDERVARDRIDPLAEGVAAVVSLHVQVNLDESLLQQVARVVGPSARPLDV